jgi:hypothetical protein
MANDFETNLILRGKDLASQPIEQIIATVRKLEAAVAQQSVAADAGAGSIEKLGAAASEANKGFQALASVQGKVEGLLNAVKRAEDAIGPLNAAKAAVAAFQSTIGDEKPTKAQAAALKALNADVTAAARELKSAERSVAGFEARLATTGINSKNAAEQVKILDAVTVSLGTKLDKTANSMANFRDNTNRVRDAAREQAKAQAEQAEALAKLDAILAKVAADEAKRAVEEHRRLEQHLADLTGENELLDQQEAARQKGVASQRATAAAATAPTLSPLGAGTAAPQFSDAAQGLASILNPAAQLRATLPGVEAEIKRLDDQLAAGKLTKEQYAQGLREARAAAEALGMQAGKIDAYAAQEAAVRRAETEFEREKATLQTLASQLARTQVVDKALENQVKSQTATVAQAAQVFERENNALATLGAGLTKAGIDTKDLAGEQVRLQGAAAELNGVMTKLSHTEGGNAGGLFNFNSPEIREAVGTVRHLTDQIANGASVTQALESHIGNFIQLGLQRLPAILPILAPIAAGLAAAALAAAALVRAFEVSESTRKFQADLDSSVDHLNTTGAALTKTAKEIEDLGVSFSEAQKVVRQFLDVGLDPSRMVEFATVAQRLAEIQGSTLAEETKKATEAFGGGAKAIIDYLIQEHALTPAIEEEIRAAQAANDTEREREIGFRALSDSVGRATNITNPFTEATRNLTRAWHEFIDYIGPAITTAAATIVNGLTHITFGLVEIINKIGEVTGLASSTGKGKLADVQARIDADNRDIAQAGIDGPEVAGSAERERRARADLVQQQAIAAELQKQTGATGEQAAAQKALIDQTTTRAARTREVTRELKLQNDLENLRQERDPAKRAALRESVLSAYAEKQRDAAEARGASLNDPELQAQIAADVAKEGRRLDLQGGNRPDAALQLRLQTAEANAAGQKGAAGSAADRAVIDLKTQLKAEELLKDGAFANDKDREKALADYKNALIAESERKRAAEGTAAANKVQAAEDGLAKELLSIKQKLDGEDKTNLAARLRGIDEEFAKYQLKLDEAKRRGASNVPGVGDLGAFQSELTAAKQREIDSATLDSNLESIKAREAAAKAALTGVSELAAKGGDSMAAAVQKALDITGKLGPAIKTAGQAALDTANRINAANPTAKSAAAVEEAQKAANGGDLLDKTVAALERPAIEATKQRDELIAAERKLEAEGIQDATTTQNKIKAAYDSTGEAIRNATALTQQFLDASLKAGTITQQQYDLMSAKAQELGAKTTYVSDQQKQLTQVIESSIQGEAVKAFDSATAALGKFIAGHEKLGTAVKGVGIAFAQFASGVLKDIANIIIKQQLLDALGFGGKGGAGDGGGGNASGGGNPLFGALRTVFGGGDSGTPGSGQSGPQSGSGGNSGGSANAADSIGQLASGVAASVGPGRGGSAGGGAGGFAKAGVGLFGDALKSGGLGSFSGGENGGLLGSIGGLFGGPGDAAAAAYNALPAGVAGPVLGDAAGDAAASSGGFLSGIGSAFTSLLALFHEGGVVGDGRDGLYRRVDMSAFYNAPRYHAGGQVGIQPGEQAAILQKGETVLTKAQAANQNRAGGGAPVNIRQILVQDPQQVSQAMNGSHGEQVVLSHIKNNAATVRSIVNG